MINWLPWRFIVRRMAKRRGFIDPIALLTHLRRFAQPSEVHEPIELLRAGMVMHARGLMNSRVIQHNLDWVWPHWISRQCDPRDPSFIPRAFSLTQINLSNRNWTAVGLPEAETLPIVDPRGLVTPHHDRWSIDGWVIAADGEALFPSRERECEQRWLFEPNLAVETRTERNGLALISRTELVTADSKEVCRLQLSARSERDAWLAVSLRPCNPEGVSFIERIQMNRSTAQWLVDKDLTVDLSTAPNRHVVSDYHSGDVALRLLEMDETDVGKCGVGMATAAALYRLRPGVEHTVTVDVPTAERPAGERGAPSADIQWERARAGTAELEIANEHFAFLHRAALHSLILHSQGEVYPGPYTYRRFWFRDAAFIIHAMLNVGLTDRAERALRRFPELQIPTGYFLSQRGEWDSNGEALWIMARWCDTLDSPPPTEWIQPIIRGARWIRRKRLADRGDNPEAGLLPAGFSAEHLGPNDFYYWDDFWGVAGLQGAASMMRRVNREREAEEFEQEAREFLGAIDRSLAKCADRLGRPVMPASPHRRMDSGAIGSLAASHPTQLVEPTDPRLMGTLDHLLEHCLVKGGFFQDMIHSGINPYLTLHMAQALLRAGDLRALDLMESVASLASPTGQWPEAIHPQTGLGCMGDGHHVWASAEWVLMMRSLFVMEELHSGPRLILAAGLRSDLIPQGGKARHGPTNTVWGPVTVEAHDRGSEIEVRWDADWHREPPPRIEVRLPGGEPRETRGDAKSVRVPREMSA